MARVNRQIGSIRLILCDSITELKPEDAGAFGVAGSHGGVNCAWFALAQPIFGVAFNDAGIGKNGAGIAALPILQEHGVGAVTVSSESAVIGEAAETLSFGVISHANATALGWGLTPGRRLAEALEALGAGPHPGPRPER